MSNTAIFILIAIVVIGGILGNPAIRSQANELWRVLGCCKAAFLHAFS